MLPCGKDSSRGLRSLRGYRPQNCLYGELPNHMYCPYLLGSFLAVFYYTCQYVRVWFARIRICHQTLSMLLQQLTRGIQPCHTSTFNRNYYNDTSYRICQYLCGRIGVWGNAYYGLSVGPLVGISCVSPFGYWRIG